MLAWLTGQLYQVWFPGLQGVQPYRRSSRWSSGIYSSNHRSLQHTQVLMHSLSGAKPAFIYFMLSLSRPPRFVIRAAIFGLAPSWWGLYNRVWWTLTCNQTNSIGSSALPFITQTGDIEVVASSSSPLPRLSPVDTPNVRSRSGPCTDTQICTSWNSTEYYVKKRKSRSTQATNMNTYPMHVVMWLPNHLGPLSAVQLWHYQ